jgi:mannose/cellobiose epimerase-like protein (N-acyl-D-glucosamine 2-epimerase family)
LSLSANNVDRANLYDSIHHWMFDKALAFWAEHGVDRVFGGYVERLRLDGSQCDVEFKRIRVLCRQIYVFSHAALLGYVDGLALAQHGYEFLTKNAWLGPDEGWARSLDRGGRIWDDTRDLYDHAFVLFALGWFYRVTADPEVLQWAFRTLDFLDAHMRPDEGRGYVSEVPEVGYRKQNPHMHLLEAALANLDASQHERFKGLADEMVALFCDHFYEAGKQTLGEYFNSDWSRAPGEAGRITEPGHHFEWAWLLANYERASGVNTRELVYGLTSFAEAFGVDRDAGRTFNSVRDDGIPLDRNSRVWPNTERIRAAVAMFEIDGRDPRPIFEQSGRLLLGRYLSHSPRGTWIEQLGSDGAPRADMIPASTLYHLFSAFAEMLRVEQAVGRAFPLQCLAQFGAGAERALERPNKS